MIKENKIFYNVFKGLPNIDIKKELIRCSNDDSFAFFVYYKFINSSKTIIVVADNLLGCQTFYNKISTMLKNKVFMYCVDETTKFTSLASSPEMLSQRIYVLNKLTEDEPIIVVTHTIALNRMVPCKDIFIRKSILLKTNDENEINNLIYKLVQNGYKNVFKVSQPFEFSTRGGVVDIFSINYQHPIRVEFFDDIIESIRFFDEETQRTISTIDNVKILPATEFLVDDMDEGIKNIKQFAKKQIDESKNNIQLESIVNEDINHIQAYDFLENLYKYYSFFNSYSSIAEYIDDKDVYILDEEKILNSEMFFLEETTEKEIENYNDGMTLKNLFMFYSFKQVKHSLINYKKFSTDISNSYVDINFIKIDSFDFNLELLYKQLIELIMQHYKIYIGVDSDIHYNSLKQFLEEKNIYFNILDEDEELKEGINICNVDLNIGLDFPEAKLYVIGENEIFKKRFKTTISHFSRYKNATVINSVNDLEIGDYLVHEFYGIGVYEGIETLLNNGVHRDYVKIAYRDSSSLFLPLEQFKLIRKYVSKEGVVPKINKLGTKEWEKTKAKVSERINDLAEKLVNLYTLRAEKDGFSFLPDDDLQEAFEADFGYELTADQKNVMNEIKHDMERPYIMDRLLVGDVGFGKTEIAFRAAFKAINSGKQVALLCPTTLLARQHYLTAIERFKNFGINIKLISRLVTEKETNDILKNLLIGKVDLLIGTHRLLSKDVIFKDLGLLIVDEEHKFGVEHKEKIKEIKQNVDVLTLTATPIPRTLQMALTGVRGFSTINTPIENRMPVQTYVIRREKHAIKEVIERELARGGQVYYLNNRIERLPSIAHEIQGLVKNAKIAIAHGKLSVNDMEDIMQRFINNEFNVLLCTTIIENGIDIPNVNTIIVENADCLGLSQLYQIKGRVGRSNRLAYAYLMYNPNKELSDIARKRLQTIKEFTALGSGYKVAMRDLVTRGAGDLLGAEQSGFIESVGIDMYIEMLHTAIEKKRNEVAGIEIKEEKKTDFNRLLNIDAYIPNNYFNNDYEKIQLYKQIDKVNTFNALDELKEQMIDETGKLPQSINMLFEKKSLDLYLQDNLLESYDEFNDSVLLKLSKDFLKYNGIGVKIFDIACKISNTITLKYSQNLIQCIIKKTDDWFHIMSRFIEQLSKLKQNYNKD